MSHFLFEIGFEEMPARFLPGLVDEVKKLFAEGLAQAKVDCGTIAAFATPRRLVVSVPDMAAAARREEEVVSGPPEKVGFDAAGAPTKAAEGFAKGQGLDVSAVFVMETPKGRYLALRKTTGGEAAIELLPALCLEAVKKLSFPKRMRWGSRDFAFGRPVHWFLALLDDAVVPFQSGRILHAAAAEPKTFVLLSGAHSETSWFVPGGAGNAELEAFLAAYKP